MPVIAIAALAVVAYLLLRQGGATATLTTPSGAQTSFGVAPGVGNPALIGSPGVNLSATASQVNAGLNQVSSSLNDPNGPNVAGAITGALGAAGAVFSALWQAHQLRARQATSENQAVNAGVQGVDAAIRAVNAAYNSGAASPAQCVAALQQILTNWWAEVVPVIQPGRNGCNSGSQCSGLQCGGSVGAACCVGCGNIAGNNGAPSPFSGQISGTAYWGIQGAIAVISMGGGQSYMPTVFGSSYGGQQRNGYWLTWQIQN